MGMIENNINETAIIYAVADLNIADVMPMLNHLLELRKSYANIYKDTDEFERAHTDGLIGFNFCNDNIKKLLGIK